MNAIVHYGENALQLLEEWEQKQFYQYCQDTGKNYWVICTAMSFGASPKKEILQEFQLYMEEKAQCDLEVLKMKIRRDERYRSNPFYRG